MVEFLSRLREITVEPVMLVDGACNQAMQLFIENVQMNKICSVNLGFSPEICGNLSNHPEENVLVQKEFSIFAFYNSILLSVPPLLFVLFMGSWSDKYGRKIPLLITLLCHVLYAGGYLINNWKTSWPVEIIYLVTLLESIGGGNVGLLTSTNSYVSDISPEKSRTSRVSTANSMWYLGGPLGTLIGAITIKNVGYNVSLGLVLFAYMLSVLYVIFFIKESHGPFAQEKFQKGESAKNPNNVLCKEDISLPLMIKDFFNWRRILESFRTAFKKREGNARTVLMAIIVSNMLRRAARGFFMYMFTRQALQWDATDYGYWVSYRNLLAALGSLFLVPLLTKLISISDSSLIIMGSLSLIAEYVCYGLVTSAAQSFLVWLGPPAGIISNAGAIAFRSLSTKLVASDEKGRINAVMSAMNGLMPMVAYAAYSPIYYKTVDTFPSAQFFFGASLNTLIMIMFIVILLRSATTSYDSKDVESDVIQQNNNVTKAYADSTAVTLKNMVWTLNRPGHHENNEACSTSSKISISKTQAANYVNQVNKQTVISDMPADKHMLKKCEAFHGSNSDSISNEKDGAIDNMAFLSDRDLQTAEENEGQLSNTQEANFESQTK